jgi:hypothetical protein
MRSIISEGRQVGGDQRQREALPGAPAANEVGLAAECYKLPPAQRRHERGRPAGRRLSEATAPKGRARQWFAQPCKAADHRPRHAWDRGVAHGPWRGASVAFRRPTLIRISEALMSVASHPGGGPVCGRLLGTARDNGLQRERRTGRAASLQRRQHAPFMTISELGGGGATECGQAPRPRHRTGLV